MSELKQREPYETKLMFKQRQISHLVKERDTLREERDNMQEKIKKATKKAVGAIYFNDSSDYLSALFSIAEILNPDLAKKIDEIDGVDSAIYKEAEEL